MGYKRLPHEFCDDGTWPRGPFRAPAPQPGNGIGAADETADAGLIAAATNLGRLVVALGNRRKTHGWSRAMLARQSGVGQHAIGRIEAGRTWPDLVTVARLTHALGMSLTMAAAGAPDPVTGVPRSEATSSVPGSLRLPPNAITAAQVIDSLFERDPRLASEVSTLVRNRRNRGLTAAPRQASAAAGVNRRGV